MNFLTPFYTDDSVFNGMADRRDRLMALLLRRGLEMVYFPEPSKSLFICDSPVQEDTLKQAFESEGLRVNVVPGSRYIGAYVGPS